MTTHRLRNLLVWLALLPVLWLAGCSKSSTPGRTLAYIAVSPTKVPLITGGTGQLAVLAHFSDGTTSSVTSGVTFTASAPSVATVSATGLVTGVAAGTGTVTAWLSDKSADAVITVTPVSGAVFSDDYAPGVSFVTFGGTGAPVVDTTEHHTGTASLRIDVPATGWTGGALVTGLAQSMKTRNALTFWAKASQAATLNVVGLGDDASGNTGYKAESEKTPLTTDWVKYIIPIPAPDMVMANTGLFHFAEGSEEGAYSIWLDDIQYETLPSTDITSPTEATIDWSPVSVEVGKTQVVSASGTVTYTLPVLPNGGKLTKVGTKYFTLISSDTAVATVDSGVVTGVSKGTATLTAQFGALTVAGSATVTVTSGPTTAPPRPTVDPAKVISLLSKAYTNVPVDTWAASWSNGNAGANLTELAIGGDAIKKYSKLQYIGIEFTGAHEIDATGMTYLHMDIWTPEITDFHVKLVDFGADTIYSPAVDDTAFEFAVNATSTPALTGQNQWVSLDIPLANFTGMNLKHLAQMVLVGATPWGAGSVYVDNVYFHNSPYIDTIPPTVAITDNVPGALATGDVTFTFSFSEDVGTSFTADDVTVTGGTKGAFAKQSGTGYTLVVSPTPAATGTLTVDVPAGAFTDLANNASTAAASASQDYDTRVGVLTQMDLPVITFDSATVAYGLSGFGGAEGSTIVVDPAGGTNKVAQVVKSATAELWAGTTLTADNTLGFAHKIPFDAANTRMTVRIYSPDAGIQVRLKVEDHTNNLITCETEATTTVANAWETLTFDFASPVGAALDLANTYDKASIFFNFGVTGATAGAKTYYFDDVAFAQFTTLTFDTSTIAYTFSPFGNGGEVAMVVADPSGGANQVGEFVKPSGDATWAGVTLSLGTADHSLARIPLTATNTRMLVRTYSPDAGITVKLKLENAGNGALSCETDATTTVANTWETLIFDFTNPSAGTPALNPSELYTKASLFFDFGNAGAGKTYYFDDVTFDAFAGTVTFDSNLVAYTLSPFGNGGEVAAVVADPSGGTNLVGKFIKPSGDATWAGVVVSTGAGFSIGKIPFSTTGTNNKMTLRVYSPAAGIPVLLKFEDAASAGAISCEVQATAATSNAWETLTFDFSGVFDATKTYNKAALFFDFGAAGNGSTYYFDDLTFIP